MIHDHEPPDGTFSPSADREISDGNWVTTGSSGANTNTPLIIISDGDAPLSTFWGPLAPFSGTLLQGRAPDHETAAGAEDNYSDILNDLSTGFEEAPPLSRHVDDPVGIFPCSDEILLHDLAADMGQSSGTPTQQDSHNSLEMQTQDLIHEDGAAKQVCRQHKRKHSGEAYNLSTRLRRQKFNGKMKALQELIPKCNKRDKDSIVDDAIKYIKNLQHQVQYLQRNEPSSSGAGFPMCLYPWMMPPASQTGMQIPTINLPQFRHNFPGMEYAMGMGMGMQYPNTSQLGLSIPCNNLLASSSTSSGLMHVPAGPCGLISESAHQDNSNIIPNINPGNNNMIAFETWPGNSNLPCFESGHFVAGQGGSSQNATPDL